MSSTTGGLHNAHDVLGFERVTTERDSTGEYTETITIRWRKGGDP